MATVEIPVTQLRIGQLLADSDRRDKGTPIREITPCTQSGKVHVNKSLCYDLIGFAKVKVSDA